MAFTLTKFMQSQIEYLGHRIDCNGIHATEGKLEAIVWAPAPKNYVLFWGY